MVSTLYRTLLETLYIYNSLTITTTLETLLPPSCKGEETKAQSGKETCPNHTAS